MAKKKKQQKVGIKKKQSAKQQKRKLNVRKTILKKGGPKQDKKMSMNKLKKNLTDLPKLIFEPELLDIHFEKTALEKVKSEFEKAPDQIEVLADSLFESNLVQVLQALQQKFTKEKNQKKMFHVQAALYYIREEKAPAYLNQIIIGIYLRSLYEVLQIGTEVSMENIIPLIQEYEIIWKDELSRKSEPTSEETYEVESNEVEAFEELPDFVFEQKMETFLADQKQHLEPDQVDNLQEDLEVFLDDYLSEKKVIDLNNLNTHLVESFLKNWFVSKMHPTKQDIEQMIFSLQTFISFCSQKDWITKETVTKLQSLLENKNTFIPIDA